MPASSWPELHREQRDRQHDEQAECAADRPGPRAVADHPAPAGERAVLVRACGRRLGAPLRRSRSCRPCRSARRDWTRGRRRRAARAPGSAPRSMVTATTIAAARPSAPTNGTPETYRPRIATTTVLPATTIAAPGGRGGAPDRRAPRPCRGRAARGAGPPGTARSRPRRRGRAASRRSARWSGRSWPRRAARRSASPVPTLKTAATSGIAAADDRAEHDQQQQQRAGQADDLGGPVVRLPARSGPRRRRTRPAGRPSGPAATAVVELVQVRRVERGGHDVPGHGGVGDGAVLGDHRGAGVASGSAGRDHVGSLPTFGHRRADTRGRWSGDRAGPGVEDDLAAVAALLRERAGRARRARPTTGCPARCSR